MATSDPPGQPAEANLEFVVSVTGAQVDEINSALVVSTTSDWQVMAGVIATARAAAPSVPATVPDVFFARQLRLLVSHGELEGKGDLRDMDGGAVRAIARATNEA